MRIGKAWTGGVLVAGLVVSGSAKADCSGCGSEPPRACGASATAGEASASPGTRTVDTACAGRKFWGVLAMETEVALGGQCILQFRAPAGGYAPEERWVIFQVRLQRLLIPPVDGNDVEIALADGTPTVRLRGELLVTVTPGDAAANRTTPARLAKLWAGNLKRALGAS